METAAPCGRTLPAIPWLCCTLDPSGAQRGTTALPGSILYQKGLYCKQAHCAGQMFATPKTSGSEGRG